MGKLDISYKELIDLGFKRFDYEDKVFFDEHGYKPFCLDFRLSKNIQLEIDSDRSEATLYKASKRPYKENYEAFMTLQTRDSIQFVLAVFGHTKEAAMMNKETASASGTRSDGQDRKEVDNE